MSGEPNLYPTLRAIAAPIREAAWEGAGAKEGNMAIAKCFTTRGG